MAELHRLHRAHPEAWQHVRGVLAAVDHRRAPGAPDIVVQRFAAMFDRAVAVSPEASVALYSLGDPARLAVATAEVVTLLRTWGVVHPKAHVLEIGCGIGRFVAALAPEVESIVGFDIAPGMVAQARQRCATFGNAEIRLTNGRDLAGIADAATDLVLAADAFPYIVEAGPELVDRHLAEAARVLRPGGSLVILNFSYRGDDQADRREALVLAQRHGFQLSVAGDRPFQTWDGTAFGFIRLGSGE